MSGAYRNSRLVGKRRSGGCESRVWSENAGLGHAKVAFGRKVRVWGKQGVIP